MAEWRFANFERWEFECHCGCKTNHIDPVFVQYLQVIRTRIDAPFQITSGYRCPDHPIEAAKERPGAHNTGRACDISAYGWLARKILQATVDCRTFTGIGIKQHGASRYIHLDMVEKIPSRARPAIWTYDKA